MNRKPPRHRRCPGRRILISAGVLIVLLPWVLAACTGSSTVQRGQGCFTPAPLLWPGPEGAVLERPACDPLPGKASPGGSFVCTVLDSVSPRHAPVPHNAAERLIFAHLYETLVQVDCQGVPRPGLAQHWTCTRDSTVWVFTLREEARFWDGTVITAADVRQAWLANRNAATARDALSLWAWLRPRSETVEVMDARRLAVHLPEPQARFPLLLAHPATAVAAARPGWTWPVGSGPCRLLPSTPPPLPEIACLPNQHCSQPPSWQRLEFRVRPGLDPRELALEGGDLAVIRDCRAAAFLDGLPGLQAIALPWDRLYVLICPPRAEPTGALSWWTAADRLSLPHDVTSVATRAWPHLVLPGGGLLACPQLAGPALLGASALLDWDLSDLDITGDSLVYADADPAARELAHRLVALTGPPARCAGLAAGGLAFAVQWQMPGAAIVALEQNFPSSCLQMSALLGQAAWLQQSVIQAPPATPAGTLPEADLLADQPPPSPEAALLAQRLVRPLAATRAWLVVRGSLAGVQLAYDATPILTGLGRPADAGGLP